MWLHLLFSLWLLTIIVWEMQCLYSMHFPASRCLILCNSFSVWWCGNFLLLETVWKLPNLIANWNAVHLVKRAIYRLFWKIILYNKSDYSQKKKDENPCQAINSDEIFYLGSDGPVAEGEVMFCAYFEGSADNICSKIRYGIWKKNTLILLPALWPESWKKGDAINCAARSYRRDMLGGCVEIRL